jgi:hypothetical protein
MISKINDHFTILLVEKMAKRENDTTKDGKWRGEGQ